MSSNDKSKKSNYSQISKNFFFFSSSNFDLSRHEWLNEIQEEWKYKVHVLKVLKIDSFPRKIYHRCLYHDPDIIFPQWENPMIGWHEINFCSTRYYSCLRMKRLIIRANEREREKRNKLIHVLSSLLRFTISHLFYLVRIISLLPDYILSTFPPLYLRFISLSATSNVANILNSSSLNYYVNFESFSRVYKVYKVFFPSKFTSYSSNSKKTSLSASPR